MRFIFIVLMIISWLIPAIISAQTASEPGCVFEKRQDDLRLRVILEFGSKEELEDANKRSAKQVIEIQKQIPALQFVEHKVMEKYHLLVFSNDLHFATPWRLVQLNPFWNDPHSAVPPLKICDVYYSPKLKAAVAVYDRGIDVICEYVDGQSLNGRPLLPAQSFFVSPARRWQPLSASIHGSLEATNLSVLITYQTNRQIRVKWTGNEWESSEGTVK